MSVKKARTAQARMTHKTICHPVMRSLAASRQDLVVTLAGAYKPHAGSKVKWFCPVCLADLKTRQ